MGDGVASRRWWERPTRQTEGGTAILSIRGMGGVLEEEKVDNSLTIVVF